MPEETGGFYGDEILANFQARSRALSRDKEALSRNVPSRIGMPTIKPESTMGEYFVEFAGSSTIHGLNHLVAPHRHPVETFLAAVCVVGALICLIFLSLLFWDRYQNNATVIAVANDRQEFQIPKPALFICPVPNIDPAKIPAAFEKHGVEHTREAAEFFAFLSTVAYEDMSETPDFDAVPADRWLEILHDLRQDVPTNVLKENDPYETWTITERGLCLATRSVFARYATLSYWESGNLTVPLSPGNLTYYDLNVDGLEEYVTVQNAALIAASDPFEMITYSTPMRWIKRRMLDRAVLSISEIKTKPNVRELGVHQRKCRFFGDAASGAWPVYSRNMCLAECRMKVIQEHCKCRPHFARPADGVPPCDAEQLRCIGRITGKLFLYEYPPPSCDCIPKCDVVSYQIRDSENAELGNIPVGSSVLTLIVELPQVIYYRSLLYGFTDFLTGVGGAAGLFLGASVLSFVEVFYYITWRAYFYARRRGRKTGRSRKNNVYCRQQLRLSPAEDDVK